MGCSASKSHAPPVVAGKTTHGARAARETLDGADWGTRASHEVPADGRHAGRPNPERSSFLERGDVHGDGSGVVWRCPSPLDVPMGTFTSSPWFTRRKSDGHKSGPDVEWRLFWAPRDHSPETCSLYLECRKSVSCGVSEVSKLSGASKPASNEVHTCFSFGLVREVPGGNNSDEHTEKHTIGTRHVSNPNSEDGFSSDTSSECAENVSAAHHLTLTRPVVDMVASIRESLGWSASGNGKNASGYASPKRKGSETDTGMLFSKKTHQRETQNCSCDDGRCTFLANARRAGLGVDMVMTHTFVLEDGGGDVDGMHDGMHDGMQDVDDKKVDPSTRWGAKKFVSCDELRAVSACKEFGDVLVEVAFHDVYGTESGFVVQDSDEESEKLSRHTSIDSDEEALHRLPPASAPSRRSPSRIAPSPLGTPEASMQLLSESPLMLVLDNFLTSKECTDLMHLAEPDLRRSRVTDGKLSEGRTSSSTFLTGQRQDTPVVKVIERRILRAAASAGRIIATRTDERIGSACEGNDEGKHEHDRGTSSVVRRNDTANERETRAFFDASSAATPLVGAEPMQVVRYDRGEMYTAHYDNKQGCVRRAATFMMYLNDVEGGGATHFPKAKPVSGTRRGDSDFSNHQDGVRIWPKQGRALVFWSVRGGVEDARSLHEAESVAHGEKWIATKWLQVAEKSGR